MDPTMLSNIIAAVGNGMQQYGQQAGGGQPGLGSGNFLQAIMNARNAAAMRPRPAAPINEMQPAGIAKTGSFPMPQPMMM